MAGKLFKGNDRRMLTKIKKTVASSMARDVVAADPKPTKRISTRTPIWDLSQTFGAVSQGQALGDALAAYLDAQLARTS